MVHRFRQDRATRRGPRVLEQFGPHFVVPDVMVDHHLLG